MSLQMERPREIIVDTHVRKYKKNQEIGSTILKSSFPHYNLDHFFKNIDNF